MCIIKRIIWNSDPSLGHRGVHYKLQITERDDPVCGLKEKQMQLRIYFGLVFFIIFNPSILFIFCLIISLYMNTLIISISLT